MNFQPACLATAIGSLPYTDAHQAVEIILKYVPEFPGWPQLPKLPHEDMMSQFTEGLPGFVERNGRTYFDTSAPTFDDELLGFYERYIAASEMEDQQALESFRISEAYASGLYEFLTISDLPEAVAVKGQVTGPVTLGTTLVDQDRKCAYYDDRLRESLVKSLAMKARWQARQLQRYDLPVIIFIDEPSMRYFGSSEFMGISREDVIQDINEIIQAIHDEGCIAGIHCCGNTDWSVIMATEIDVLSHDTYEFFDKLMLYADELKGYIDNGGIMAWGITPTLQEDKLPAETAESLASRLEGYFERLYKKGISADRVLNQSLITPSCGMRGLSEELALRALELTRDVSRHFAK